MTDACEECGVTGTGAFLVSVEVETEPEAETGAEAEAETGVDGDGADAEPAGNREERVLCEDCAAPQPCERCGRSTSETTVAGTFRCNHCSDRTGKRRTPGNQHQLADFAAETGGGR